MVGSNDHNDNRNDTQTAVTVLGLSIGSMPGFTQNVRMLEGDIRGEVIAVWNETMQRYEIVSEAPNANMEAIRGVSLQAATAWRDEMTSLTNRMSELRDAPASSGAWARVYGSERSYGPTDLEAKHVSVQVGADAYWQDWFLGAAFMHTTGSADMAAGESDHKTYGLMFYGTWIDESGLFVDLTAGYGRLNEDFDFRTMSGEFDQNAFSMGVEVGWRFEPLVPGFFVEPPVQLSYAKMTGDDFYASNGVKFEQDDVNSLLGRVGVRAGFAFTENKGSFHFKVSMLHEFEGDVVTRAKKGTGEVEIRDDIGGTAFAFGFGGSYRPDASVNLYARLERTTGGELNEDYRWYAGMRYAF